jgi:hypothetical protein
MHGFLHRTASLNQNSFFFSVFAFFMLFCWLSESGDCFRREYAFWVFTRVCLCVKAVSLYLSIISGWNA